ncbi:MAG: phosphoribosylanthranilate isomerase [PVC group bacterium]
MDRIQIKICGLTREEDVLFLSGLGVDFAGFIFVPGSPRFLDLERAGKLTRLLPAGIRSVGVFLDEEPEKVKETAAVCGLDILQFHGNEPPEYCEQFSLPYFKVIGIGRSRVPELPGGYRPVAFLLDTLTKQAPGGTGKTFDWTVACRVVESGFPVILAGGLTPQNVRRAVREVKPRGVDVSSGVESAPGIKDHDKMQEFVCEAQK